MKYLLIIWACLCTLFNLQAAEYSVVPKPLSVKETGKPALCLLPGQLSMSLRLPGRSENCGFSLSAVRFPFSCS